MLIEAFAIWPNKGQATLAIAGSNLTGVDNDDVWARPYAFLTAALAPDLESLMSGRTYMLMTCHGLTAIDVHEKGGDYRWCPPCNAGSHGRCRRCVCQGKTRPFDTLKVGHVNMR